MAKITSKVKNLSNEEILKVLQSGDIEKISVLGLTKKEIKEWKINFSEEVIRKNIKTWITDLEKELGIKEEVVKKSTKWPTIIDRLEDILEEVENSNLANRAIIRQDLKRIIREFK